MDNSESKSITPIMQTLNWAYDRAIEGVSHGALGIDGAEKQADEYLKTSGGDIEKSIDGLILNAKIKAGTVGALTSVGGFATLPITIPANIAGSILIQLRLIASIAHLRGYSIHGDHVRTLCFVCFSGSTLIDILKDVGINLGAKFTQSAISQISGAMLTKIN